MQVDVAIDAVDKMSKAGFTLSSHLMQSVLETCSETDQHFRVLYILLKQLPCWGREDLKKLSEKLLGKI